VRRLSLNLTRARVSLNDEHPSCRRDCTIHGHGKRCSPGGSFALQQLQLTLGVFNSSPV